MELFGDFVRKTREAKGLKQAPVCKELGINQSYLSAIEGNKKFGLSTEKLAKLADILDVDFAKLANLMFASAAAVKDAPAEPTADSLQLLPSDLPVLGPVAAGPGVEVEEADIETKNLAGHGLLVVRGDSLSKRDIRSGHKVIVKFGPGWKAGDLVVARVNKGFMVKKANKKGNTWWLEPACDDPNIHAVKCDRAAGVEVIGTVVGVLWG